jgi:hypothetical protein
MPGFQLLWGNFPHALKRGRFCVSVCVQYS